LEPEKKLGLLESGADARALKRLAPFFGQNGSGKVNGFQKDTDDSAILFFGKKKVVSGRRL